MDRDEMIVTCAGRDRIVARLDKGEAQIIMSFYVKQANDISTFAPVDRI